MINYLRDHVPWDIALRSLIWTLAAMVLGLFDLYNFRFDPRRFMNSDYLSEVGILLGLGLFIFVFRLLEKVAKLKGEDTVNSTLETTISGYVNGDNKLKHIVAFLVIQNLNRRVIAYKEKMQKKVSGVLEKLNTEEMRQYSEELEVCTRRVKKLRRFEAQNTDEYIKKNKLYLAVKFIKLSPDFMTSGFNSGSGSENMDPAKRFRVALRDNFAGFVIPSALVMFVLGSILSATEADVWAIVLVVSLKLLLLLFQHWSAGNYAPTYLGKTWIHDLHLRKILWEEYFAWIILNVKKDKKEVKTDG